LIETIPNRYSTRPFRVEIAYAEFASLSPLGGATDSGAIAIRYVPFEQLLELRSLREYLQSFAKREILKEDVANAILDEVVSSCGPYFAEVEASFEPGEGTALRAVVASGEDPLA
jgi:7-cyano-7-deazaguanine reductase